MKKNVAKLIAIVLAAIGWNGVMSLVMSFIHGKYGTVQMDTGQIATIYKIAVEYMDISVLIGNIILGIVGSYLLCKIISNKE